MADITSVKLPNGVIYDIKDELVRKQLEELLGTKNPSEKKEEKEE